MIWYIFLIIAVSLIAIFLFVYLSPFGIAASGNNHHRKISFNAAAYLIHPAFCKVTWDYETGEIKWLFCLISVWRSKKGHGTEQPADDTIKKDGHDDTITERGETAFPASSPSGSSAENETMVEVKAETTATDTDAQRKPEQSEIAGQSEKTQPHPQPDVKTKKRRCLIDRFNHHPAVFFIRDRSLREKTLRWILRVLKSIFTVVKIRRCNAMVAYAFDDPSVGGKMFGYIEGVRNAMGAYSKEINFRYVPHFKNEENEFDGDLKVETSLCRLSFPLVLGVLTLPYYTFGMTWWRYRSVMKKGKKDAKRD